MKFILTNNMYDKIKKYLFFNYSIIINEKDIQDSLFVLDIDTISLTFPIEEDDIKTKLKVIIKLSEL